MGSMPTIPQIPIPFCAPSSAGWLLAVRDPQTGLLKGGLRSIDSKHIYWVRAQAALIVGIDLDRQDPSQLPPIVPVQGGFVLKPFKTELFWDTRLFCLKTPEHWL